MSAVSVLVAIDIVEDQVVRLTRGALEERTVYGGEPVETARRWEKEGADWLHVVDLDGATKGEQENSAAVQQIIGEVGIPVQIGGGIRSLESIEGWIKAGAERVVLGTKALDKGFLREAVKRFGEKVVAAVDAHAGEVKIEGWRSGSGVGTVETVQQLAGAGVSRVMFTDIDRDGTLSGPNLTAVREVAEALDIPVIASGGITTAHDVRKLAKLSEVGLEGMIIGKALYSGAITLEEAKAAARA